MTINGGGTGVFGRHVYSIRKGGVDANAVPDIVYAVLDVLK